MLGCIVSAVPRELVGGNYRKVRISSPSQINTSIWILIAIDRSRKNTTIWVDDENESVANYTSVVPYMTVPIDMDVKSDEIDREIHRVGGGTTKDEWKTEEAKKLKGSTEENITRVQRETSIERKREKYWKAMVEALDPMVEMTEYQLRGLSAAVHICRTMIDREEHVKESAKKPKTGDMRAEANSAPPATRHVAFAMTPAQEDGAKLSSAFISAKTWIERPFAAFAGKADYFLHGLVGGSHGVIAATANLIPKVHVQMLQLYDLGKLKEAQELQTRFSRADWVLVQVGVAGLRRRWRETVGMVLVGVGARWC